MISEFQFSHFFEVFILTNILPTLLLLNKINNHPIIMGQAKMRRQFFLPHLNDMYPAGMDPKNAPKFINDPTQDASLIDKACTPRSDVPCSNIGVAGDDQPPTHPELRDIIEAKKKKLYTYMIIDKFQYN